MKEDVVREINRIRVHMGLKEPKDINERIKYFYKYLNSDGTHNYMTSYENMAEF